MASLGLVISTGLELAAALEDRNLHSREWSISRKRLFILDRARCFF
jgi:hypothetical protein